jgi:hypothetical protein
LQQTRTNSIITGSLFSAWFLYRRATSQRIHFGGDLVESESRVSLSTLSRLPGFRGKICSCWGRIAIPELPFTAIRFALVDTVRPLVHGRNQSTLQVKPDSLKRARAMKDDNPRLARHRDRHEASAQLLECDLDLGRQPFD